MYEHLETLRPEVDFLLSDLSRLDESELNEVLKRLPECPEEYLLFLQERGAGPLLDRGEHFVFERVPKSAEHEYFQDRQIYELGASGDIWVFGWESMGTAYGFDSGESWALVEVDEYRLVSRLELSFKRFVEGLLVCYPQIAVAYEDGCWIDGTGRSYSVA